jgi:tyrosyl-tRNA synthetase
VRHNVECIQHQLSRLLDFEPGPFQATLVNNADWTTSVSMLEFLRDVGKHFTVNQMMAKDSVRSRIESEHGISFTEFSYMLLQANDFRHLYEHHGVELQAGASDQWGNIVAGVDLIRRAPRRQQAYAITHPLMTKSRRIEVRQVRRRCGLARPGPHLAVPVPAVLDADRRPDGRRVPEDAVAATARRAATRPRRPPGRARASARATRPRRRTHHARARRGCRGECAAAAATVLFGGDPTRQCRHVLEVVAGEAPCVDARRRARGATGARALIAAGVAKSSSEVGRLLTQGAVRAGNRVLDADGLLRASDLLTGGFVLIRKGKRDFVVGKVSHRG